MEEIKNKYYLRVDKRNRIIYKLSSAQESPLETDIEVGQGNGTQFQVGTEKLSDELQLWSGVENGLELIHKDYGLFQLEYVENTIFEVDSDVLENEYAELVKLAIPTNSELNEKLDITMIALAEAINLVAEQQITIDELNTKVAGLGQAQ